MTEAFNLDIINKYKGPQKAFAYIKFIISYALAFVSFFAFLLLLYGFYMMKTQLKKIHQQPNPVHKKNKKI